MVNNWLNIALSRLFPYRCVLCQQPSEVERDLCLSCERLQSRTPTAHCSICAIPLPSPDLANGKASPAKARICGECLKKRPCYDRAVIPYIYVDGIRHMISRLKFNSKLIHADLLATLFMDAVGMPEAPEALIPMPLHNKRLRERGYNQSLLLARAIGRRWNLPIETGLCKRVKHTPAQAGLSRKQRRKNIKGVFTVSTRVPYRHIAIIDDVLTTGSSTNELAKMFKQAGVERVDVWCIARTLKD